MSDQQRAGIIHAGNIPEDRTTYGPRRPIKAALCLVAAVALVAAPVAGVYLDWFEDNDRTAIPLIGVFLAICAAFWVNHHWTGPILGKKSPDAMRFEARCASAGQFLVGLIVAAVTSRMLYQDGISDNSATYIYFAAAAGGISMMIVGFLKWR
jgi:fatty acid desaturase